MRPQRNRSAAERLVLQESLLSSRRRARPRQEETRTPGMCEATRGQWQPPSLLPPCTSCWATGVPRTCLSPRDLLPLRATARLLRTDTSQTGSQPNPFKMLPEGGNVSCRKRDLGPSKQESQPQQNPRREGERSQQRPGDATLSASSQDVPSMSPEQGPHPPGQGVQPRRVANPSRGRSLLAAPPAARGSCRGAGMAAPPSHRAALSHSQRAATGPPLQTAISRSGPGWETCVTRLSVFSPRRSRRRFLLRGRVRLPLPLLWQPNLSIPASLSLPPAPRQPLGELRSPLG